MSGVFIEYGNIAPEAKENFFPKATEKESFVELSNLQKYDLSFPNFGNPCELYQTLLDGTAKVIPSLTEPEDFERFIALENQVLAEHHGTQAVHTFNS